MKYIIEGRSVGKVLQENRIRIARGELKVTPLADDVQKNCPEVPEAPIVPEVPEVPEQEVAPEVPEVPVTGEEEKPEKEETKELSEEAPETPVEDAKEVTYAPADTKAPQKKTTKKK